MASAKTVWGVDIGQCALKALKLRLMEGELRVEAFDIIEHPKILSQPEADRDQLMRNALEQFLAQNNVAGSTVVIAAPGQSGFTRFVKLPPVEEKRVPEIVRFEAEQQIPFDIHDVIWRWQAFTDPDSPDVEVGIFAMKRTDVGDVLDRFDEVGIGVDVVQMAPLALYNFASFDEQCADDGATLVIDVGADKTDLVVSDGARIWTRTIQLGGNNFTNALVKAFKLGFNKAEKLKRTAATSKYARQIFQAMRPVFAELVQEIQRSIGYYTSLHRESRFQRVVGLGNGFRLPGLQKFLEQNLNVPVVRVDSYNKLPPSQVVNAPAFTENVLSFAVAYGLALQGAGLTKIQTNLLPTEIARKRLWATKRPWFAAAAAMILATVISWGVRQNIDANTLKPEGPEGDNPVLKEMSDLVKDCQKRQGDLALVEGRDRAQEEQIRNYEKMLAFRDLWPKLHYMLSKVVENVAVHQRFLKDDPAALKKLMYDNRGQPRARGEREVVFIEAVRAQYMSDVAKETPDSLKRFATGTGRQAGALTSERQAGFGGRPYTGGVNGAPVTTPTVVVLVRGYILTVDLKTPLQAMKADSVLNAMKEELRSVAEDYAGLEVIAGRYDVTGAGAGGLGPRRRRPAPTVGEQGPTDLDPLTGEDASMDKSFRITWALAIKQLPVPVPDLKPPEKEGPQ